MNKNYLSCIVCTYIPRQNLMDLMVLWSHKVAPVVIMNREMRGAVACKG